MARLVIGLAALALAMLATLPARAAELRDPTRPPPGQGADGGSAPTPPAPAKLTSVMLRPGGRSLAMVDGVPVRVGDRLAEGTVTAIDEGGLWLRTEAGPKRIELLPVVAKTPTKEKNGAAKMEKKR